MPLPQPGVAAEGSRTAQELAGGQNPPQVARNLGLTAKAVRGIGGRYEREGLERGL
jgi:hypothetical protein